MNILVAAFEPFDCQVLNPALEALRQLPHEIGKHKLTKLELPTVFYEANDVLIQCVQQKDIDAILTIGQAGGRSALTPERVAINIDDARIPDNKGQQPIDTPIQQDGAPAYFSNMPVKRMTAAIQQSGVEAKLSNTAGTFVCNHIFYQSGYLQATQYPQLLFGFIHVPYISEQCNVQTATPSLSLATIVTGLTAAITAISYDDDASLALGQTE